MAFNLASLGSPSLPFASVWRVPRAGKRQAWTPIRSHGMCGLGACWLQDEEAKGWKRPIRPMCGLGMLFLRHPKATIGRLGAQE